MRALDFARLVVALALIVPAVQVPAANSAEPPRDIKGLYLITDYPAITVRPWPFASMAIAPSSAIVTSSPGRTR